MRRLLNYHRQGHASSGRGVATTARRRLVLVVVVVVQRSTDLDVIFIIFGVLFLEKKKTRMHFDGAVVSDQRRNTIQVLL